MSNKHTGEPMMKKWMRDNLDDYLDPTTDEVNCTKLAEECAHALNHSSWLDDENHPVWDMAIEVSEEYENRK